MTQTMGEPCLIGIDCGTQSVRAIAFDRAGRKLAGAARPTPIERSDGGGEYDPDAIFAAAIAALREVASGLAGRPVAGIAVASIGESCVLIDATGKPTAPAIAWFDRRTQAPAKALADEIGRERIFAITGHSIEWTMTLFKLAWMHKQRPDAIRRARHILMMADWIAFRLCGEPATDHTLASRTQYFDIHARQWSAELIRRAGVDTALLPPLKASGTRLGPVRDEVLAETGLTGKPVVGVGGHDHVVGSFAAGITAPGTMLDSLGTAEALFLATAAPIADPEVLKRGYIQGAIATHRKMSFVGAGIFSSGGALEWLRHVLGDPARETIIAEAGAAPPGSRGVVFLPHLANSPPPEPDPESRGAFVGLSPAVDRGTLYRAVLEGLAMQARLMVDGMNRLPGVTPVDGIRVIGGGSRNALFLRIKANAFARPLTVIDEAEATALGAALLGGIAAGIYRDLDEALAGLERREHVIEPDGDAVLYEELRARVFEQLHPALKGVNHAVAGLSDASLL
jgi:xylulokinase